MKNVPDHTGRFATRPHYETAELDQECEHIITDFMRQQCGGFRLPVPTEALTKLIERDAEDLDLFADLTQEGSDVEGVTDFLSRHKPRVRISATLSNQRNEHRLRTTLGHEYGHVKFHDFLWQLEMNQMRTDSAGNGNISPRCKRDRILNAPRVDWMEWQAGYVSGALLMPAKSIREAAGAFLDEHSLVSPILETSNHARLLVDQMGMKCGVSTEAARIRLLQLKVLTSADLGPGLL